MQVRPVLDPIELVMSRRGFFAELHHQAKIAARNQEREQKALQRARVAALREAEASRKREAQLLAKYQVASSAEQKRLEKQAKATHIAVMEAEVLGMNLDLAQLEEDLGSILAATLEVDDFVDLESLRIKPEHPPFDRPDLEVQSRPPFPIEDPPQPQFIEPPAPRGLKAIFQKRGYERALKSAKERYEADVDRWKLNLQATREHRLKLEDAYREKEDVRIVALGVEKSRYSEECALREKECEERNRELDDLIAHLGYGTVDAVQEYVGIVLSNAVYPNHFPVRHEFLFDPEVAELRLRVSVPSPDSISTIKGYKYNKSSDEIVPSQLSQKSCKDRYASAIGQVALRSAHEIFEADRRGLIRTISLEVGTQTNNPATGLNTFILFVALGAERETFMLLDLSNVVPSATLAHLGAAVSKDPFGLVSVNPSGVRRA